MVWGAIAAAGIGLVGGIVQGSQQRSAADAANKTQSKQIKAQYERDKKEWELNYLESLSDYEWSVANVEAQRYQDRVRQQNYEAQQERIIDSALNNLELNTEALRDQYIESERLRRLQVDLEMTKQLGAASQEFDSTLSELAYRSADTQIQTGQRIQELRLGQVNDIAQFNLDNAIKQANIDNRSMQSTVSSMEAVAGYMNSIKTQGIQADRLLSQVQDEGKNIQEQIVIGEQLDTIQRDAQQITALLEGADKRASSVARGGGSNSARRVAMDSMKEFGRSFSQMKAEQANRRRQLNNYNSQLTGETAAQFAQLANNISNERERIKFTRTSSAVKQAGFLADSAAANLQRHMSTNATMLSTALGINQAHQRNSLMQSRLAGLGREAEKAYDFKVNNLMTEYNELTLPSFDLAARQGEREYQALLQNTMNTIDGASTPYQEAIIFDPLEPIAGLKPEKGIATKVAKPGWGSILTNSFIQGAQGALGMSYTNSSGNLAFR